MTTSCIDIQLRDQPEMPTHFQVGYQFQLKFMIKPDHSLLLSQFFMRQQSSKSWGMRLWIGTSTFNFGHHNLVIFSLISSTMYIFQLYNSPGLLKKPYKKNKKQKQNQTPTNKQTNKKQKKTKTQTMSFLLIPKSQEVKLKKNDAIRSYSFMLSSCDCTVDS